MSAANGGIIKDKEEEETNLARDEEKSGHVVSGERGVEASAHLACHVLSDILAEQRFDVLL